MKRLTQIAIAIYISVALVYLATDNTLPQEPLPTSDEKSANFNDT